MSPEIEDVFRASTEKGGAGSENLLDLDVGSEAKDEEERLKIQQFVDEIEERLGRLNKIQHERGQVLKDLKDKVRHYSTTRAERMLNDCIGRSNKTMFPICSCSTDGTLVSKALCLLEN